METVTATATANQILDHGSGDHAHDHSHTIPILMPQNETDGAQKSLTGEESGRRHSLPAESTGSRSSRQQQQQQQQQPRSYSRHSMPMQAPAAAAVLIKPHVSQTADQRPDEKLKKYQYKAQLQKQIDERRRLKEERLSLDKQEEELLQLRVEQERNQMEVEQHEELERKRLRDEAIKQREELTLKQIEVSRRKAEEERRKRLDNKRQSTSTTTTTTTADSECEKPSTYANPHDEQVLKANPLEFGKLLEHQLKAIGKTRIGPDIGDQEDDEEVEDGDYDPDEIDDNSLSTYYERVKDDDRVTDYDTLSTASTPPRDRDEKQRCPCPIPVVVAESKPKSKSKLITTSTSAVDTSTGANENGGDDARALSFMKTLKDALAREQERMRIIINQRAVPQHEHDFDSGTEVLDDDETETEVDEEEEEAEADAEVEQICDCNLPDVFVSSEDSEAVP